MYSLKLALKKFTHKLSAYIIIILEIGIGLAVLMVSLNLLWSINDRLNEINHDKKNKTYYLEGGQYVDYNFNLRGSNENININANSYEDYLYLKNTYGNKIEVLQFSFQMLSINIDNEMRDILIFYTTPEFFDFAYNDKNTILGENQIYVGKNAYEAITNRQILGNSDIFGPIKDYDSMTNKVTMLDGSRFNLKHYEYYSSEPVMMYYLWFLRDLDTDNAIIVPGNRYNPANGENHNTFVNTLGIYFPEEDPYMKMEIINHFNETYFSDSPRHFSFFKAQSIWDVNVLEHREIGELLKIISVFSIIIVVVGLIAYNLMQFNKRKKEIAIKKSIGCGDRTVLFESILESCIVSILGGVLGIVLGLIVSKLNLFQNDFFVYKLHTSIIIIFILLSLCIGIISNVAIHLKIKKLKPMQLLKEE